MAREFQTPYTFKNIEFPHTANQKHKSMIKHNNTTPEQTNANFMQKN